MVTQQYEDELVAQGGKAAGEGSGPREDLISVEGTFVCEIVGLEPVAGTKFQSTEFQQDIRITYRTIDHPDNGGWVGYTVDERMNFTSNLANEQARLHKRYVTATGVTPQPNVSYPLKRDLIGKRVKVDVSLRPENEYGTRWPKVDAVTPFRATPPPPPKRGAPVKPAPGGIEDDPLEDPNSPT